MGRRERPGCVSVAMWNQRYGQSQCLVWAAMRERREDRSTSAVHCL